jgi:hypothetical protein
MNTNQEKRKNYGELSTSRSILPEITFRQLAGFQKTILVKPRIVVSEQLDESFRHTNTMRLDVGASDIDCSYVIFLGIHWVSLLSFADDCVDGWVRILAPLEASLRSANQTSE